MRWLSGVRGLILRFALASTLAVTAAIVTLPSTPSWVWPITTTLHKPIEATLYLLWPGFDSYPYYVPVGLNISFMVFVALATALYLGIMYIPTLAVVFVRATWVAMRTPWPFMTYAVMGGVIGGIMGFMGWVAFSAVPTRDDMYQAILAGSAVLGWSAAVIRCAFERRHLRLSL